MSKDTLPPAKPRVLLAIGNVERTAALREMLAPYYQTDSLIDGSDTLTTIREYRPDLLLCEICTGIRDGFMLIRSLRTDAFLRNVPIIVLSANQDEIAQAEEIYTDADNYLIEPFSAIELNAHVAATLNAAQLRMKTNQRYRFLIELDDATRPLINPDDITRTAAQLLGLHLGVNRCAYADVEEDQDTFNLTGDYHFGVASIVGRYTFTQFGAECLRLMHTGLPYVVEDAEIDPRTKQIKDAYRQTEIRSVICVPLLKAGRFVAAMAVHQAVPRRWRADEIELLQLVASRCWESIERTRVTRELRDNEARYRTLVETVSAVVWRTDGSGAAVPDNPLWGRFTGQSKQEYQGWGWLDTIHPDDRAHSTEAWHAALRSLTPYQAVYRLRRHDGEYRHMVARAAAVLSSDGKLQEWVGNCVDITESKRSAEALREAHERLDAALIAGEVATWVWHITDNLIYADRNMARLFGLDSNEEPAQSLERYLTAIHPDDRLRVAHLMQESVTSENGNLYAEYRIVQPHGALRSVIVRGQLERRVAGKSLRMPGVMLDVTERVQMEEALKESQERMWQLANTIPQLAWMANTDGRIHWYNDRWYAYTGQTLEQMDKGGWHSVHDPDMLPDVIALWNYSIATGEPFEMTFPLRGADGEFRPFFTRAAPLRDASGAIVQWFGTNTDVSTLEKAEQAVRESEERLREGLVAASMAVWDWDLATDQIKFSGNAIAGFGQTGNSVQARWDAVHPDDIQQLRHAAHQAIAQRSEYQKAVRMIRPDNGEIIWIEIRGKVKCDALGNPCSISGISLDITERRRAEEELRAADRRKDEFLAMLAHELRNPLAPISTAAQILKLLRVEDPRVRQTSEIIARQVEHMTGLIDDLLDVSRVTRGLVKLDKEPLDLRHIVNSAVEQVRPLFDARRHQLSMQISPQAARVMGDRTRLIQIMANLLNNAAKYTQSGGHLVLALTVEETRIQLSVRDDGCGIGPELLPHVFELFTQAERSPDRSQGGLGLGLALVKSLVELHGGSVAALSDGPGKGSEFIVSLPRLISTATDRDETDTDRILPASGKALRVMVVDDNVDAAQILAMLLQDWGHNVSVEIEAIGALERARTELPQVFLLDIGLPDMDGYELARCLRRLPETASSILIALTGYGQAEDRERSKAAGFDYHLVKPAHPVELAALLDTLASAE